jgi:glucose/arabinose dehydrogenase
MRTHSAPRPRLLALFGATLLLATLAAWQATGAAGAANVVLTPVASGLSSPVYVASPRDGSGRLFIVEQTGRIRILSGGSVLSTPFLDVSSGISHGGEQGLLGLAFHPNFKANGLFFVNLTRPNGDTVVNRYRVSSTNPNVADRSSAYRIITIGQPYDNHNGGTLQFGPDGYLYIGMGDGGSSGDPGNRAQSLSSLLGKMLRIDINGSVGTRHYRIPSSNPYVGRAGRNEIWARGLRNPWKFSFDRATGTLWIGDVGQNRYEEIDRSGGTRPGRGLNYGWRVMEGRHCHVPSSGCNRSGKVSPVVEYGHGAGCSVTGGYAYRGTNVRALYGRYVFADYCSGTIWSIPRNPSGSTATRSLVLDTSLNISSFGESASNELFVVDHGGTIYRIDAP